MTAPDERPSRFHVSMDDLERAAHVPDEEQIVEIPAHAPARAVGDDDLSRQQRDALRAGG